MRFIGMMLLATTLSGCFWGGGKKTAMSRENAAFPEESLIYKLSGSVEENRLKTIDFLSDKGIRYRQLRKNEAVFLITGPMAEPPLKGDETRRRSAFRFRFADSPADSGCVLGAVTWLVEARHGDREQWETGDAELTYTPSVLKDFQQFLKKNRCK
ncbi:MAG TPA: hypothetical protein PKV71_03305 [Calditrichia bacterium]|nr:hypothetical protein [Calditrichota bacterium]HQU74861.1 hypothetical protein [Calditrichia bacterium]HQV30872.1 hypothetical protein [Calditrichia bacterium]